MMMICPPLWVLVWKGVSHTVAGAHDHTIRGNPPRSLYKSIARCFTRGNAHRPGSLHTQAFKNEKKSSGPPGCFQGCRPGGGRSLQPESFRKQPSGRLSSQTLVRTHLGTPRTNAGDNRWRRHAGGDGNPLVPPLQLPHTPREWLNIQPHP